MKTILFVLFVLFIATVFQPSVNVSYAQDNCTCAECGYPCKTPMVHASNCKYKNKRQTEESSDNKVEVSTEIKSLKVADDPFDIEYQMLLLQFKAKMITADANIDAQQKEKQIQEIKEMMGKLTPETEELKIMHEDIMKQLK